MIPQNAVLVPKANMWKAEPIGVKVSSLIFQAILIDWIDPEMNVLSLEVYVFLFSVAWTSIYKVLLGDCKCLLPKDFHPPEISFVVISVLWIRRVVGCDRENCLKGFYVCKRPVVLCFCHKIILDIYVHHYRLPLDKLCGMQAWWYLQEMQDWFQNRERRKLSR